MGKEAFELERELKEAREAYHEAVTEGEESLREIESRSQAINKLVADVSAAYTEGAIERPKGVKPVGMKRRRGYYEVGNGEVRSQGETPKEAIKNWNDGVFFESSGPGVTKQMASGE